MATENPPPPDAASNGGTSPHSRRRTPWASVVRGDSDQNSSPTAAVSPGSPSSSPPPPAAEQLTSVSDSSTTPVENSEAVTQPPTEGSEVNGDGNAGGRPRRSAWNRPSNGVVEPATVMGGAVSWPALSETTRPVQRSAADAPRPGVDGSPAPLQAPIISQPPQRPVNNNTHTAANNSMPNRPRSRNRNTGGGGNSSSSSGNGPSQNTHNQPPPMTMPPPFPYEVQPPPPPPFGMVPPVMDTSVRGPRPAGGSQLHTGSGDQPSQRNNQRRGGGYGHRPRGDGGPYHNNRRDQDRRDVHHHPPQFVPPSIGYMPPPMTPAAPFMAPPPMRVFPGQVGFDVGPPAFFMGPAMPPPETFRTLPPGVPPLPPPMMYPSLVTEEPLPIRIVKQIDFYFSDDNLVKDVFLRSKMDDHGWVPISLIASFRRVENLTKDIPLILDSLRYSTVVEVQGDKVRRRNEWTKFLPLSGRPNPDAGPSGSNTTPENALATSLHEVSLDDATTSANGNTDAMEGHKETSLPAAESTAHSELANGDDTSTEKIHS